VETFLQALPNGENQFNAGLRRICSYLYQALLTLGQRFFLDKAPRDYYIIAYDFHAHTGTAGCEKSA
jgi:hypothetical protein